MREWVKELSLQEWQLLAAISYYAAGEKRRPTDPDFVKYGIILKPGQAAESYERYGRLAGFDGSAKVVRNKVLRIVKKCETQARLKRDESETGRIVITLYDISNLRDSEINERDAGETQARPDRDTIKNKELIINKNNTLFGDDETITSESYSKHPKKSVSKKTQKVKTKDPRIKAFIDYAFDSFKAAFNAKLAISSGKDGVCIARLLKTYELDELKSYWKQYLDDDDDFVRVKSIAAFSASPVIMRYVQGESDQTQKFETCNMCSGDRELRIPGEEPVQCPMCKGMGKVAA